MDATQVSAPDPASRDPAIGLAAVAALRRLADRLEHLQVANARDQGWSWQEIANALGVTRQAVHKKHAVRIGELSPRQVAKLRDALGKLRNVGAADLPGHRLEALAELIANLTKRG